MEQLVKKTALVSGLTLVSRILGMIRDAVIAMLFGGSLVSDIFFLVFRPFDLLRKMFSSGVLTLSFVPVLSRYLVKDGSSARGMVSSCLALVAIAGGGIVALGYLVAPLWVWLTLPQGLTTPLAVDLFRTMLPYVWFIMAVSLAAGVLQCLGNFHLPALAPSLFNLVVIGFSLGFSRILDVPIRGLAWGVVIGCGGQLLLLAPGLWASGLIGLKRIRLNHPGMLETLKKMVPAMVGSSPYQINILVASFFASTLAEGNVSFLYYADRLIQFPLGLIAVSLSTVLLPTLATHAARGEKRAFHSSFNQGMRLACFVSFPAMAGLMALSGPVVQMLFGHGAFGEAAVSQTGQCLFFLALGLGSLTVSHLCATLHFGRGSMAIPLRAGVLSMGVNALCCWVLGKIGGLSGLAISVSLASAVSFLYLWRHPPGNLGKNPGSADLLYSACRAFFLSVILFFLIHWASPFLILENQGVFVHALGVAGCIFLGICFIFGAGFWVCPREIRMVTASFKRR